MTYPLIKKSPRIFVLSILLIFLVIPLIGAHSTNQANEAYVRVIEANPETNTYTFSCSMNPENDYLRDYFIRQDSGDLNNLYGNEAEILDKGANESITYTFENDGFYHIGCVIVNSSNFSEQFRGDLHIDLRENASWNPQINFVNSSDKTIELSCDYSPGEYSANWEVLNAQTGKVTNLGAGKTIVQTIPEHGLYDYVCHVESGGETKTTGMPIEFFDSGKPYYPDSFGVPHGIENIWVRNSTNQTMEMGIYNVSSGENIPSIDFEITNDSEKYFLDINVENISLVEKPGEEHVDGEGHLHWYLDSVKQGRIYSEYFELPEISLGIHKILLSLSTNDHREYYYDGERIELKKEFEFVNLNKNSTADNNTQNQTDFVGLNLVEKDNLWAKYSCKPEGSSEDLVVDWNFGDGESVYDVEPVVSHDYLEEGYYYVQCDVWDNSLAEFNSLSSYFEISLGETNETQNNETNSSEENNTVNQTKYYNLEGIPSSCEGGEIINDEYFGGRRVECENVSNGAKLTVEAWDKPNSESAEYFEMYKKAEIGGGLEVCIANTCISNSGFAKSQDYPLVVNSTFEEPNNDTTNNETNNETQEPTNNTEDMTGIFISNKNNLNVEYSCKPEGSSEDLVVDWNFGDGESVYDVEPVVSHDYLEEGYYYVQCDVWDNSLAEFNSLSSYFEISLGETNETQNNETNSSEDNSTKSLTRPVWLSHSGTENVAIDYFHFEVNEAENKSLHALTDWEVWDKNLTEKVWSFYGGTDLLRYHVHTPDGNFEGSLEGGEELEYNTTYMARARFKNYDGTFTNWSNWRNFTTEVEIVANETDPTWTVPAGFSVESFSEGFDLPVHVVAAPKIYENYSAQERPFLYVTELYGKIKVVYENGSQDIYADNLLNFDPFGSITGGGQMGLIGLVVEPESGDLFASMVYIDREDNDSIKNKIVRFYSTNDGKSFTSSEIIIDDLPSAPSHQIEQLSIHEGRLFANLGDAQAISAVQDDSVLVGKIISMNLDGSDVQIYAKGFRNPFGVDWSQEGTLFVTDNAPDTNDRLVKVLPGENYGWGMNDNFSTFDEKRIATLNVSPVDIEFNYDSEFQNELYGRLYVAVAGPIYQEGPTNGKEILEFSLDSQGEVIERRQFVYYTGQGYGTPMGLEFLEGALYFTDIYGEAGFVGLGETEGMIYRVVPGEANNNQSQGEFRVGLSVISWYPKDAGDGIEYIFECKGIDGSSNYKYNIDFGDGSKTGWTDWNRQYHKYPYGNQDYEIVCQVEDLDTNKIESKSIIVNPSDFIEE